MSFSFSLNSSCNAYNALCPNIRRDKWLCNFFFSVHCYLSCHLPVFLNFSIYIFPLSQNIRISIPLIFFRLSGVRSKGQQISLSPATSPSTLGGFLRHSQAGRHSPSSMSWVVSWASSQWVVPRTIHQGAIRDACLLFAQATLACSSQCRGAAPPSWLSLSPYLWGRDQTPHKGFGPPLFQLLFFPS